MNIMTLEEAINKIEYLLPFFVGGIFCRNINLQNTKWIGTAISFCAFIVCLHYFSFDKAMYNMGDNIFIEIVIAIVVMALTIVIYNVLHKNNVLASPLFGEVQKTNI